MQEYGRTKGPYHKNWCCSLGIMHPLSSTCVVPRTQMLLSGCRPPHVASVRTCKDPMQFCSQLQSGGWGWTSSNLSKICPTLLLFGLIHTNESGRNNKARFSFGDLNHITLFCSLAAHPSQLWLWHWSWSWSWEAHEILCLSLCSSIILALPDVPLVVLAKPFEPLLTGRQFFHTHDVWH